MRTKVPGPLPRDWAAPTDSGRDFSGAVAKAADHLAGGAPEVVISWAFQTFSRSRIALCTSFQLEGMVVLDMAHRLDPNLQVFTIDTGRLPAETLEFIDRVRERYGLAIEMVYPDGAELSTFTTEHGANPFYRSVHLRLTCCQIRKANPLKTRLQRLDAWITGLRRTQARSRTMIPEIEIDSIHGNIVKISPLARWSAEQVDEYSRVHEVPRHPLYEKGYASIGCAPCTRPLGAGDEDPRGGRWWWETGDKECGIHYEMKVGTDGSAQVVTHSDHADRSVVEELHES